MTAIIAYCGQLAYDSKITQTNCGGNLVGVDLYGDKGAVVLGGTAVIARCGDVFSSQEEANVLADRLTGSIIESYKTFRDKPINFISRTTVNLDMDDVNVHTDEMKGIIILTRELTFSIPTFGSAPERGVLMYGARNDNPSRVFAAGYSVEMCQLFTLLNKSPKDAVCAVMKYDSTVGGEVKTFNAKSLTRFPSTIGGLSKLMKKVG